MSWIERTWGQNKEKQYIGFILLSISVFFMILLSGLIAIRFIGLGDRTPFYPIIYFFILVLISFLLALKSRFGFSLVVSSLLFMELFFGYASMTFSTLGVQHNLKSFLAAPDDQNRFVFHPMLGAIPQPNYSTEKQTHAASGVRNINKAFDTSKLHIAVFGGSTTYDVGVSSDAHTWVSRLQAFLPTYTFSNNGVIGYSTAEHVVQTAFYPDRGGTMPVCSVYYIGWNDIRNFGILELDNGYANFHLPSQYGNLKIRASINSPSPVINILYAYFARSELPFPTYKGDLRTNVASNHRIFDIVERNLNSIISINEGRGIKTVFVAQMLNTQRLANSSHLYSDWIPYVLLSDVWKLQERFNIFIRNFSERTNAQFIDPQVANFTNNDFIDSGHFNDVGATKFAQILAIELEDSCGLN